MIVTKDGSYSIGATTPQQKCRGAALLRPRFPQSKIQSGIGRRLRTNRIPRSAGDLPDLEAREAPDGYVLAQFGDGRVDHLTDGLRLVLDVMLLVPAPFLGKLLHLAFH